MEKKTLKTIVITFLATTLFWYLVQEVAANYVVSHLEGEEEQEDLWPEFDDEGRQEVLQVVGKWVPVETASDTLELTKYGKAIKIDNRRDTLDWDLAVKGDNLYVGPFRSSFKLVDEDGTTYLELYGDAELAGKYRKQ